MNLLNDNIQKIFRKYMLTAFGSAIIVTIYSMVDIICVGQYAGPSGAAALACITPMWSIFISIGILFGIGGSVRMSFCRGEGRKADGDQYFTASLAISLLLAVVITVLSLVFHREILYLFGADDTLIDGAMAYSKWIFPVIPAFLLSQVLGAFIRNDGAPTLCTVATLTGGILNMILDLWFVFGLDLGMSGAGLATAIGQMVSILIACTHFFSKRCTLRLARPKRPLRAVLQSAQAGVSPFLVDMSYGVAVALFNNQVMRYGNATDLAVYGTVSNIALLFQCLFYAVGQALQPIVSVNFGAKKTARVHAVFRMAMTAAIGMGGLFCLSSELLPGPLLRLYMDVNEQVMTVGPPILRVYAVSFLLMGFNVVVSYYLQSVLQNRSSVLISLCRGFGVSVVLLFALPALFGLDAIWWTMPLTELLTFLLALALLRRKPAIS